MPHKPLPDIDILFEIRTTHRPGFLAGLFKEIGEVGGLIGDIKTSFVGKGHALREITISVYDAKHRDTVENIIKNHPGAALISSKDVVFDRHRGGKIQSKRSKEIYNHYDMRCYYTPGVARVCEAIKENPECAREFTNISNHVAIMTNGSRVLGLGDIGPLASMPVMEGKAMIYDQFVGLAATPILIDTKNEDEFIETVERIALTFGGIHLEDIRAPDCFRIEEILVKKLNKPVMHDDQHGTATVALAAIMSSMRNVGRDPKHRPVIAQIGLGAAGFGIAKLCTEWGARVIGVDPDATARKRLESIGGETSSLEGAIQSADVVVSTTGVVGLIKPSMIQKGQIILALSNPYPEISVDSALEAGASFASDGAAVNNALAYPGLFKAALMTNAQSISVPMKIAASTTLSNLTDSEEILPSIFKEGLHQAVIEAVAAVC